MSDNRLEGSDASSFLRDLVHELASPLNSISMNAEILEAILQKDVHGSALEAVERLTQDHCRLELLLRGLRTYAEALKIAPPE